ncbi:MAG: hypothetical protein L0287_35000 [Anaerolineae bacterium]|nr:hypothetical protein [Anaerolineae bacterium]
MKKLTVTYADDVTMDLTALLPHAIDLKIETIKETNGKKAKVLHRVTGMSVQKAVMEHYTAQGVFSSSHAVVWAKKHGYAANSSDSALSFLVKGGYLKAIGRGRFMFAKPFSANQLKVDHA